MSARKIILWLLPILMTGTAISSLLYETRRTSGWNNDFSEYNATPEGSSITGIAFDKSNRPWLGIDGNSTWGHGLSTYNGENWETYSEENSGLASNRVVEVTIDLDDRVWVGYKWFGGGNGISAFDGVTWTTYTKENSGLLSNAVTQIAIDPSNKIWVGYGGDDTPGVSGFDGETWTTYAISSSTKDFYLVALAIDPLGRVWLGFDGGGISIYEESWTTYTQDNSGLASNKVFKIAFDSANRAWIVTQLGISVFDRENWITYTKRENSLLDCHFQYDCNISIDLSDKVWVSNRKQGVSVFDGASWMILTEDNSGLVSNEINDMEIDRTGKIWFITSRGVSIPPENPTPIAPHLVRIRNLFFSPKLSLWITLSLLAGLWIISYFTVGNRTETIKKLGASIAFGCLGLIIGPISAGVFLGFLGWGDETLIYGILYFGVPLGVITGFAMGVSKFRSLKKKDN